MYPWHDDGGALRLLVGNFIYGRVTMALAHDDKGTIFNYGNSNRSHTQPAVGNMLLTFNLNRTRPNATEHNLHSSPTRGRALDHPAHWPKARVWHGILTRTEP